MYELLLVSTSPRRREILNDAGFSFRVDTVKISEIIEENVSLPAAIAQIAKTKARAYLKSHNHLKGQDILVLSADTMVVLDKRALGKPKNRFEAELFLRDLSQKTHRVITGIYLENLKTGDFYCGADTTEVEFRALSPEEIRQYVDGGEPMDKAGAYAIQGEGKKFVKTVNGSTTNVIGLPLELLEKVLSEKGWHVARKSTQNRK